MRAGRYTTKQNVAWNLLGQVLPLGVALVSIPPLIRSLGTDRFGVLALVWAVNGYFTFFDFGIGRALTQLVAARLGSRRSEGIYGLTRTALLALFVLGSLAASIAAALSPFLVGSALKMPHGFRTEALHALWTLAVSLPASLSITGAIAVLAAYERFDLINFIKTPLSLLTYLGPLAVSYFSHSLVDMVATVTVGRIVGCGVLVWMCKRIISRPPGETYFFGQHLRALANFASWMTVSNVLAPLFAYLDRFLIGALVSASAVAYYTTPFDMITKLWIVSTSIVGVLFPVFARSHVSDRAVVAKLYERTVGALALVIVPAILFFVAMSSEVITAWVGPEFAEHSSRTLQLLALGVAINCLGHVPSALIQAAGRPDITGKLHLLELPLYVTVCWVFTSAHGIEGAAAAWTARVTLDTAVLMIMARRTIPGISRSGLAVLFGAIATTSSVLFLSLHLGVLPRALMVFAAALASGAIAWRHLMNAEERAGLLKRFRASARTDVST